MTRAAYAADVVVVGGGLAGLTTALELLDHGCTVLVLERDGRERLGGLARDSFGGIFVVGTREQRWSGFRDSERLALDDWLSYGELDEEDDWPRRWAEAYVERCRDEVYGWLRRRGVRFLPLVHWVERGLDGAGNSVPRFHLVWGTGRRLIDRILHALETHPRRDRLRILTGHRVTDLTRTAGAFDGCVGVREDGDADGAGGFVARGDAVVIAAGGITGNLEMVRRHWAEALGEPPATLLNGSDPAADGALHDVVRSHGGRVTHLDRMWNYAAGVHHWRPRHPGHGLSLVPPRSALWLDSRGRRFGPRPLVSSFDTRHLVERICRQAEDPERKYSWQVLNRRIAERELAVSGAELNPAMRKRQPLRFLATLLRGKRSLVRQFVDECPDVVTGETVPELAARMSDLAGAAEVDAERLREEVRRYDRQIEEGPDLDDPELDRQLRLIAALRRYRGDRLRTCKFARIDDPDARPLIAIREFIVTRKSLGGIQTDLECRVLDAAGAPMPGLFAVGEAAGFGGGGMHGVRSLEGTFLGGCILTGRIAARATARGT